jgi:enterochelin esterase family protein
LIRSRHFPAVALGATLTVLGCGTPASSPDGGTPPGNPPDAGTTDAGRPDGGHPLPDGGRGPDCTRAGQAVTANIALLHQLESDLAAATTDAQKNALLTAFYADVADGGGTPLVTPGGTRVAFVAAGVPDAGWSVGGTWNGWTPGATPLQSVQGTALYAAEVDLPYSGAYPYKLVDGSTWYEDLLARNVVWDGIDHLAPGQFNGLAYAELSDPDAGRLRAYRGVPSTLLQDQRDVFVYVPTAYDVASCPSAPVMYFTDGNESLTRIPFQAAADQQYGTTPADAALLVFVGLPDPSVRTYQYTYGPDAGGDLYFDFLSRDLAPVIARDFRLSGTAHDTGLAGASLGGLMAAYGAYQFPQTYGYVGAQSGSFWWLNDDLIARYQNGPVLPVRFYLDCGTVNENTEWVDLLIQTLQSRGYALDSVIEDGGQHDWSYWQPRLPRLLHDFRQ